MDEKLYRPNVAVIILNSKKEILLGHRRGFDQDKSGWQLPQGGIHDGESPEAAVLREVEEETGLQNVIILGQTDAWIFYTWPPHAKKKKNFVGQKQVFFVAKAETAEISKLTESEEFDDFKWAKNWDEVMRDIVEFKRESYTLAHAELKKYL